MRSLIVKQLDYDLTPVAGLSLVGHHLKRLEPVFKRIDEALPVRTGVKTSDIVRSYVGLLVQGKSDFEAIESFRGDKFYKQSLGIELLFLPKQWPELNPMDHLWRHAKGVVSANRQYDTIDQQAGAAEDWFLWLTPNEARRKAGMLSKNFWLRT